MDEKTVLGRTRVVGFLASGLAALALGCGTTDRPTSTTDAADGSCASGTVPLSYFTTPFAPGGAPICSASYLDAIDGGSCVEAQGDCAGYRVIGQPAGIHSESYDCFYDSVSGMLVGGWITVKGGSSCAAGTAHAECGTVDYTVPSTCSAALVRPPQRQSRRQRVDRLAHG